MKKKVNLQRPESAIQFDNIYREHHDPDSREKRKIMENRNKRAELIKQDNGL